MLTEQVSETLLFHPAMTVILARFHCSEFVHIKAFEVLLFYTLIFLRVEESSGHRYKVTIYVFFGSASLYPINIHVEIWLHFKLFTFCYILELKC